MKIFKNEVDERIDYILKMVKLGISRVECQTRFQQKYNCGMTQTRVWYSRAIDSLIVVDKDELPRTRAVILEILHAQLVGYHQDSGKITDRLAEMDADRDRRSMIQEQLLIVTDDKQTKALIRELKSVPTHSIKTYLEAVDRRGKTRERIIKCCTEIGRLHGCYVEEMPLSKAISVLAQAEVLPASIASNLLSLIGNFEKQIDSLSLN